MGFCPKNVGDSPEWPDVKWGRQDGGRDLHLTWLPLKDRETFVEKQVS